MMHAMHDSDNLSAPAVEPVIGRKSALRAFVLAAAACTALSGCATSPPIEGAGAIACAHVDTMTTKATTVYIAAGLGGVVMVKPDCTMAVQLVPPGPGI